MRRIGRHRCSWVFAWGSLCLLGAFGELGTKAWSQAQQSDNPAAPGQSYLTGDWGGVRSSLERLGVTFTFNYTNDFLANVGGGIKTGGGGLGSSSRMSTSTLGGGPNPHPRPCHPWSVLQRQLSGGR